MKPLKKILILLLLMIVSVYARSNYCIQVTTLYDFDRHNLSSSVLNILRNFDKARIDRRGSKFVLRVGDYRSVHDADADLERIQDTYYDAYVRRCDYDPSRVVYAINMPREYGDRGEEDSQYDDGSYRDSGYDNYDDNSINNNDHKELKEIRYRGQDRSNYDLYQQCRRCFAPMELEASDNHPYTREVNRPRKKAQDLYEDNGVYDDEVNYDDTPVKRHIVKKAREAEDIADDNDDDKNGGGFFDFLKKPQYRKAHKKAQEEYDSESGDEDKAHFFDYLKKNKYEDDEYHDTKQKKQHQEDDDGFFGLFKEKKKPKNEDMEDDYGDDLYEDTPPKKHIRPKRKRSYDEYDDTQEEYHPRKKRRRKPEEDDGLEYDDDY
ncbi:hypothetical protein MNB_SM-3-1109 [hydrothermal vent metagenome]|uniref:Uncharacterized protein n=1 Tax=hydrothermal vent metagenome TaxID=652676 RepID=A0A1W1D4X6_9ZZZZ